MNNKKPFHEVTLTRLSVYIASLVNQDNPEIAIRVHELLCLLQTTHVPEAARKSVVSALTVARHKLFVYQEDSQRLAPLTAATFDEVIAALTPPDTGQQVLPLDGTPPEEGASA